MNNRPEVFSTFRFRVVIIKCLEDIKRYFAEPCVQGTQNYRLIAWMYNFIVMRRIWTQIRQESESILNYVHNFYAIKARMFQRKLVPVLNAGSKAKYKMIMFLPTINMSAQRFCKSD